MTFLQISSWQQGLRATFLIVSGPVRAVIAAGIVAALVACSSAAPSTSDPIDPVNDGSRQQRPPPTIKEAEAGVGDSGTTTDPDAGSGVCKTVPPTNRCGLDPQCGCGVNETCDVTNDETGATSCTTAGSATLGRPCGRTGDCAAGLTCAFGACRPYCTTARSKCNQPGTDLCIEMTDSNNNPYPLSNTCSIVCDPWDAKGACGTNRCDWFESFYKPFKISDCSAPGTATLGQACKYDDDCVTGHLCIGSKCERWCRMGQAGDCPSNKVCDDYFGVDGPTVGGVKRGVCLVP